MWRDLGSALALMFVLEGILPFLNPRLSRDTFDQLARMDDRSLRTAGLVSMVGGALLLYLVK